MSIRGMKRRAFIAALGGAAVWPMATRAPSACSKPTGFNSLPQRRVGETKRFG